MARPKNRINNRGLGMELTRYRKAADLTLEDVGERLGVSAATLSRMETGKRPMNSEDVAAILAIIGVRGIDRERLVDLARGGSGSGLVETSTSTTQSRTYLSFESQATVITNFELALVPGLAQTAEYANEVISTTLVHQDEADVEARVGRRMARQAILTRRNAPRLNMFVTESALRRPVGGAAVMARQVRSLADLAGRPKVSLRVIPADVVTHAGLDGSFVILDFANDPTVVHIEARTTGLFREDPDEIAIYKLTVEKLEDVAVDEHDSVELLRSIARDLDGG